MDYVLTYRNCLWDECVFQKLLGNDVRYMYRISRRFTQRLVEMESDTCYMTDKMFLFITFQKYTYHMNDFRNLAV